MKKLTGLFIFIICSHFAVSQTVLSSCSAPDSISSKYMDDADRMTLKRIYQQNLTYKDSIVIPQEYTDTILRALIAVYNATALPARNAVVSMYNIHTFPYPVMNRINVAADSNLLWMQQLNLGNIPTGNIQVDSLISKYNLSIQDYKKYYGWFPYHVASLKSDSNHNIIPLTDVFETILGVAYSETLSVVGDGNDISATIYPNHVELTYSIGWGDCPAGCIYNHYWKFNVYYDCSVEFLGEYGSPIPVPPTPIISVSGSKCTNQTLTVTISNANSVFLNNQPISPVQFTLSSLTPASYLVLASNNIYPGSSSASASISIIDCAAPTISIKGSNCINDTLQVVISGANSYSLNNQPLSASQFTLSSASPVSYVILASNSTYSTSNSISVVNCNTLSTSINENKLHSTISVYPNPANEILNIELQNITKETQIELFDVFGKVIIHTTLKKESSQLHLDVALLPCGIYYIKAGSELRKFVKN